MAKRTLIPLLACLVVVASGGSAFAQSTQFSLELGYQWLDVSGNRDVYRSQVNEDDGALLQGLSLMTIDTSKGGKPFDRIRVSAAGFGGSPQGTFHVDAGLARTYHLRVDYRRASHFNALPDYANPLLGQGVTLGQHTLDRTSDNLNVELELLPGYVVTPLIGYRWYEYGGRARTTYHAGEDDFQLASDLALTVHELRGGFALNLPSFHANVLYGQRSYSQTDKSTLAPGAGGGNLTRLVLGRDINMTDLYRHSKAEGTVPFTTASFSGTLGPMFRLVGSYVRADNEVTFSDAENFGGSLASFDLSRFFQRFVGDTRSKVDAPDRRFDTRLEADLVPGLGIELGYTDRQRTQDGWSLLSGTYMQTVNYSGADLKDVQQLIESRSALERNGKTFEATLSSRDLGAVRLFATLASTKEELTVDTAAAEVVIPGGQGGKFERTVDDYSAGMALDLAPVKVSFDYRHQEADELILRTDYRDQDRWRVRLEFTQGSLVRVLGTAERIELENPHEGFNYDAQVRRYGVDVNVTPAEWLTVRLGGSKFDTDSTIKTRNPFDFSLYDSIYAEDGRAFDGSVAIKVGRIGINAGYSRLKNEGAIGLELKRTFASLDLGLAPNFAVVASYDQRKYTEATLKLANFDATRYGLFLRWQQ